MPSNVSGNEGDRAVHACRDCRRDGSRRKRHAARREGVIDLDAPIQRYRPRPLPEYDGYESLASDPRYKLLTARMLLDHSSGFANLRVLEPGRKTTIHFDPGSRYAYSGQGIQLLQLVVETVTKKAVEDLKARIGIVIMTNSSNGEGIFKELLESLLRNTFTPIEWEGFTPYEQLPPRRPPA
jgi:hypothetical protein